MPKTERKLKTPAEKATAALGVEQRRVDKLQAKHDALTAEAAALEPLIDAAKARRDYLAQHPDLPDNHTTPIAEVDAVVEQPKRGRGRAAQGGAKA